MQQNINLGSNGVDRVHSLRKIPKQVRGTNFCTNSARFAPSFVRQPNGPECTQIVRNTAKRQFRVQWSGSGGIVAKNSDATSWHKLLHLFGPFCIEFRKATKQFRMHPNSMNTPNVSLGSHGVDRVPPLRKNPTRLRGTNFCTSSARFATSFVRQVNGPECTQIVQNAPKRQFRVQWGGSGAFVAKNSDATSWHELLHYFGPFCTEFRKATKRSQMHPNSTKHIKTAV